MRFFYGVEAPLFTWCLVRLFLIRELTSASLWVLATLLICILAFAIDILEDYQQKPQIFIWLQMIAHTLMLLMGVYAGLVLLFYTIPVAISIIAGAIGFIIRISSFIGYFFSFQWLSHLDSVLWISFWGFLWLVLFSFTATLFVGMPFAVTTLYINLGLKILRNFARQYGKKLTLGSGVAIISLWLILLFAFNQQPQVTAFNLLEKIPQNRQALLASSETIRKGLVNANLYPYRYLSNKEDNNHIYRIYKNLGFPKSASLFLQHRYNQLLAPFLYNGSNEDVQKSAKLYAEFFDTPIQKAERKAVRHAIQSTSIVDRAKAGLLNIDQKKVWLEKQEVTINPHGDWADIELHEVYNNQTNDVEEILYYFSLPESSAITGLWLGETEDLAQRFSFQVSPRGAAQEVYNSQVRRTRPVDPALLEQVGFRQYRLRAFPVPPRLSSRDMRTGRSQRKMHLWLTYQVMKQDKGWALPRLAEKRNIFWTQQTKRIRNGKRKWFFRDAWLEAFWHDDLTRNKQSYQINLENGYTVAVQPLSNQDYILPKQQKYALILDTSYSMRSHHQELAETLDWCKKNLTDNDLDIYLTDESASKARRIDQLENLDINSIIFYGSIHPQEMLQQWQLLHNSDNYDAVFLITDEGSYELSEDRQNIPEIKSPLWMIHLGGKLPTAYNDAILQIIQNSNGGVTNNIATIMKRIATEKTNNLSVIDGYSWNIEKSNIETNTDNSIEALAARQLVAKLSKKSANQPNLQELDTIHQIAQNYDIVTPYSSMIVLVNDEQRELLKKAEAKTDRFEREVENGVEQLDKPFNPFEVSGVSEPDLWLLLGVVAIALFLVSQRQKAMKVLD
jgi:putative PEP-CTERM system integral membrane protein